MREPLIGIVLDHAASGSFSDLPHYALREHYFSAVEQAGGVPLGLGYVRQTDDCLDQLDGLLSPGGQFETPADWYLGTEGSAYAPSDRLRHDLAYLTNARRREMPVLGVCAGMQLLAGLSGCKLVPDLTRHFGRAVTHHAASVAEGRHKIIIAPRTSLSAALGLTEMTVNSHHREAVVRLGPGVVAAATSADGVIEAIELSDDGFTLGVQWHPETPLGQDDPSARIFDAFVERAIIYKLGR